MNSLVVFRPADGEVLHVLEQRDGLITFLWKKLDGIVRSFSGSFFEVSKASSCFEAFKVDFENFSCCVSSACETA